MDHHLAEDLLGPYVDGSLSAESKAELERHLATCDVCRRILEEEAPIQLPAAPVPPAWTQKRIVRSGRRALLRAALIALLIYLMVGAPLIAFARQGVGAVIERNGRGLAAAQAPLAIGTMFVPGGQARSVGPERHTLSREYGARISRRVGGVERNVADIWLRLGLGLAETKVVPHRPDAMFPGNPYSSTWNPTGIGDRFGHLSPGVLPDGSVVTVQLFFDGLSLDEARVKLEELGCRAPGEGGPQAVRRPMPAPAPGLRKSPPPTLTFEKQPEVRFFSGVAEPTVTWIGFAATPEATLTGYRSVGGLGDGGYVGAATACDLERARSEITQNLRLLSSPYLHHLFGQDSEQELEVARRALSNNPKVVSVVVTGPTRKVEALAQGAKAINVFQLEQDLYNY